MTARRYKLGQNRQQTLLLPPSSEDYVALTKPVRALDAYVETLDWTGLGFPYADVGIGLGQPAFHAAMLTKLYRYGYLNGLHRSRKLEREAARNLAVLGRVGQLPPGDKTLAHFRKDNSAALKAVNQDFMLLGQQLELFGGETVAVDGRFFKADASKDSIYTEKKPDAQRAAWEKKIEAYQQRLAEQDASDDKAGLGSLAEEENLADKITRLKEQQALKKARLDKLAATPDQQLSTVDADARWLKTRAEHRRLPRPDRRGQQAQTAGRRRRHPRRQRQPTAQAPAGASPGHPAIRTTHRACRCRPRPR